MTLNDILPVLGEMAFARLRSAEDLTSDGFVYANGNFVSGTTIYFPSSCDVNGLTLYRAPIRLKDLNNCSETEIHGRS